MSEFSPNCAVLKTVAVYSEQFLVFSLSLFSLVLALLLFVTRRRILFAGMVLGGFRADASASLIQPSR